MARAFLQLPFVVLITAAACGRAGDGAAAEGRSDTARQDASPAARDTAQARETVLRLEEELFQSYARRDTAPAARILADDYVGVTGDGHRETKAQALATMRRDSTTLVEAIELDSTTVRVYGDAAVAQTRATIRARDGRQPAMASYRNTDVFVWRDGRWQIVATHLSRITETQRR